MTLPGRGLVREWSLLALLLAALLILVQRGGWVERADLWIYDAALQWRATAGTAKAAADPVIVAIDEASLARVGRWPWPRRRLVELMRALTAAGAGTVLLDIVLAEADDRNPAADRLLAAALRDHVAGGGRVVLPAFVAGDRRNGGERPILPLPAFAGQAVIGHAQALVDADGLSRRLLPSERVGGADLPHLAWAALGQPPPAPGTDEAATARGIVFAGPPGHFPQLSAANVIAGQNLPDLGGRIVLVGATATGLMDRVITPLAADGGAMAGVEFIANAIDALRAGELTRRLGPLPQALLSLLLLLALLAAYLVARPRQALAATVALCLLAPLASWLGLALGRVWWPPAPLMLVAVLAFPLWSWRRLEASLTAMERESGRIANLVPGGAAAVAEPPRFLDPVEKRIHAVASAVDRIAGAIAAGGEPGEEQRHREEMLRHLAHDLRSPLISLRGLADELRGRIADGGENPALARIDHCARRALDLSEQFILFGRAESLAPQNFREVNLVDILYQASDDLWQDGRLQGACIVCHSDLDGAWAHGDYRLIYRALLNLGWNALRHGPPQGAITLFLNLAADGHLHLGARDQGPGFIPGATAAPGGTRPDNTQGHGLGLAFVHKVAAKHGLALETARDEEGFAIWLRFPPPLAPRP